MRKAGEPMVQISVQLFVTEIKIRNCLAKRIGVRPSDGDQDSWLPLYVGPVIDEKTKAFLERRFAADPKSFRGSSLKCLIPESHLFDFGMWLEKEQAAYSGRYLNLNPTVELKKVLTEPYWKGVEPLLREWQFNSCVLQAQKEPHWNRKDHDSDNRAVSWWLNFTLHSNDKVVFNKLDDSEMVKFF